MLSHSCTATPVPGVGMGLFEIYNALATCSYKSTCSNRKPVVYVGIMYTYTALFPGLHPGFIACSM